MSSNNKSPRISPYLLTLYQLLTDLSYPGLLEWDTDGQSFMIIDISSFGKFILKRYFKHKTTGSFFRQLNLYGFKRLPTKRCKGHPAACSFKHTHFKKDGYEELHLIKRMRYPKGIKHIQTKKLTNELKPICDCHLYKDSSLNSLNYFTSTNLNDFFPTITQNQTQTQAQAQAQDSIVIKMEPLTPTQVPASIQSPWHYSEINQPLLPVGMMQSFDVSSFWPSFETNVDYTTWSNSYVNEPIYLLPSQLDYNLDLDYNQFPQTSFYLPSNISSTV